MTETTNTNDLPGALQQAQLISSIAETVGGALPAGWSRARLVATMTASVSDFGVWVTREGAESKALAPRPATKAAKLLRELMYEPGKGTWFTMTMTLHPQGSADTAFDYNSEPDFAPVPISDSAFVSDLKRFPRDAEHTPNWLRNMLGS